MNSEDMGMTGRRIDMRPEVNAPLPPLHPFVRCVCGRCRECRDNEKWDRVFAKFEVKNYREESGLFRSPLADF